MRCVREARVKDIYKPIFIVGSGRSGTTLLLDALSHHPDVAWFSNYTNRFPAFPQLAALSGLRHTAIGRLLEARGLCPRPAIEGNAIYSHCGIHTLLYERQQALVESDLTAAARACFTRIVQAHLRFQRKSRFLHKNTNNGMRLRYLLAMFPDALFVHLIRDGRAVANSLYHVAFWPDLRIWWLGQTPREWEDVGNDPIELCGLHWQRQLEEILTSSRYVPAGQYMEVRYEQFVGDPIGELRKILCFVELDWSTTFERRFNSLSIEGRDDKWRRQLSAAQIETLERVLAKTLQSLGYL